MLEQEEQITGRACVQNVGDTGIIPQHPQKKQIYRGMIFKI